MDWARINEMPQWFIVQPGKRYSVAVDGGQPVEVESGDLVTGLPIDLGAKSIQRIRVGW